MPLLGLFGKKSKQSVNNVAAAGTSTEDTSSVLDSILSSPTSEYVVPTANHGRPPRSVYPSAADATSPKKSGGLFSRSRKSPASEVGHGAPAPHPPFMNGTSRPNSTLPGPDAERLLRPPPSKAAMLNTSTRSLPEQRSDAQVQPKKSFFGNWTAPKSPPNTTGRNQLKKSKSPPANGTGMGTSNSSPQQDSFNLKSFRHVSRPPSPARSEASNISLSAAPPRRPRGPSVASDSSQRISVAAFREAQARRSQAGSPSPSFNNDSDYRRSPAPPTPQARRPASRPRNSRVGNVGTGWSSDEDDSEEEQEQQHTRLGRNRTVTQRSNSDNPQASKKRGGAQSELGHGTWATSPPSTAFSPRSQSSLFASPTESSKAFNSFNRPESTLGVYGPGVQRQASRSTSAISPRASALPPTDPLPSAQSQSHIRQPAADSDSDSDDAPLASLVPPKRPGSAASSASAPAGPGRNASPFASTRKPLIDINTLSHPALPKQETLKKTDDAFTQGNTLVASASSSSIPSQHPRPIRQPPLRSLTSTESPIGKFPSPPSSPVRPNPPPLPQMSSSGSSVPSLTTSPAPPAQLQRKAPVRKTTAESALSVSVDSAAAAKRDLLSERLNRVVNRSGTVPLPPAGQALFSADSTSDESSDDGEEEEESSDEGDGKLGGAGVISRKGKEKEEVPISTTTKLPGAAGRKQNRASLSSPPVVSPTTLDETHRTPSNEDLDLASLLGGSVKLISMNGEEPVEDLSSAQDARPPPVRVEADGPGMKPILIKERTPTSGFRVVSRPTKMGDGPTPPLPASGGRQRSSTLVTASPPLVTSSSSFSISNYASPSPRESIASPPAAASAPKRESMLGAAGGGTAKKEHRYSASVGAVLTGGSGGRQRSSTMMDLPKGTFNDFSSSSGSSSTGIGSKRPPAAPGMVGGSGRQQENSPATSSTGDSSSGRAPLTPRDGSEISVGAGSRPRVEKKEWSGGVSGLGLDVASQRGRPAKKRGVSFDWDEGRSGVSGRSGAREDGGVEGGGVKGMTDEERRNERRRGEAKAAIELGNVINGRGPTVKDDSDDDEDVPINQALQGRGLGAPGAGMAPMGMMNPMAMGSMPTMPTMPMSGSPGLGPGFGPMNMNMNPAAAQMQMQQMMMMSPPSDPKMFAAHQQAMLYAKQAYQMAVAQQAMAAAADEWERGSVMGGGGSVYGGGGGAASVYGGGGGGSVYGGVGGMGGSQSFGGMGFGGMGGMGMMMNPAQSWSAFPPQRPPMFGVGGGGGAQSEYGGPAGRGGGNWSSSRSVYGETFGTTATNRGSVVSPRESGYFPPMPPMPQQQGRGGSGSATPPRQRTASQPAKPAPGRNFGGPGNGSSNLNSPGSTPVRRVPPPSSWKK